MTQSVPDGPVPYPSTKSPMAVVWDGKAYMYVANNEANTVTRIKVADGKLDFESAVTVQVGRGAPNVTCANCGATNQIKGAECLFCHEKVSS